jgi:formylmethanofuran dehydrogenase subunit E
MTLATLVPVDSLQEALTLSAARHERLCPRQVLGVRIGLAAATALRVAEPRKGRRLLAFVETDGCFVDGLEAATGCSVGHRTLKVEDYGKVAATFYDVERRNAVRIAPRAGARERAFAYAAGELRRYDAQLSGYQNMPTSELLDIRVVQLVQDVDALVGEPGQRVICASCREEIMNGREVTANGSVNCRACAGKRYYVS